MTKQEVINYLNNRGVYADVSIEEMAEVLAVNPRPKGEWAEFEGGYRCSNCDDIEVYTPNFCPNCGAKMQKGGTE